MTQPPPEAEEEPGKTTPRWQQRFADWVFRTCTSVVSVALVFAAVTVVAVAGLLLAILMDVALAVLTWG